jgi:DNA-binding protein HU-beta
MRIVRANFSHFNAPQPLLTVTHLFLQDVVVNEDDVNKADLIERVSKNTKIPKVHIQNLINATIDVIEESVAAGEPVKIAGFGTFLRSRQAEKKGRNPKTGTSVIIPPQNVPKFRPSKDFK